MTLAELASALEVSGDYLLYLKSILDGTETNFPDEDLEDAQTFEELLNQIEG